MQTSTPALPRHLEPQAIALHTVPARTRAEWVDIAKGIGIVLVVIGHAIDGLLRAHLIQRDGGWSAAFYLIYTFHMPLFFLLAGLFVQRRLTQNADGFVGQAFTRIAWPYLLWSVIQLSVIGTLGSMVNSPFDFNAWRILSLLWEPGSHFWFLHALLILHLIGYVLVPRIGATAFLLTMLLARAVSEWLELPVMLEMPARFGLFYALGLLGGPLLINMTKTLTRVHAKRVAAMAVPLWLLAALTAFNSGQGYGSLLVLPVAFIGIAMCIALATLPRAGLANIWSELGRASLAIYLLHVLFVAGARIILHKIFGIDQTILIMLLTVTAGIVGPLVVREIALRTRATHALGLG